MSASFPSAMAPSRPPRNTFTTIRSATNREVVWFCERLGYAPGVDIKCIVREWVQIEPPMRESVAMVGFDHWTAGSCEMHIWTSLAPTTPPIDRVFIREALNYVFSSGRTVIIGRTPSGNRAALDFSARIGFEHRWKCLGAFGAVPGGETEDLVFQELTMERALKWFPDHIIERYYKGAVWLEEAKERAAKAKEAMEARKKMIEWNPADYLTKIPPSSPRLTSKLSSKPWTTEIKVPPGDIMAIKERADLERLKIKTAMEENIMQKNAYLRELMAKQKAAELEYEKGYGSAVATLSSTTESPSDIPKNKS
jgi:hypothetical protein